jgi:small subunit ribosomal protein S17
MAEEPENLEESAADTPAPSDDTAADAATSPADAADAAVAEDDAGASTRAASADDPAASSDSPASEPEPVVAPKERRARGRAAKAAKAKPRAVLSPEERRVERAAERRKKAELRRAGRLKARAKAKAGEHQAAVTPPREHVPGTQKTRLGVVVSDKADKTITVRIDLTRRHRKYQKVVSTRSTLHAHDESNDAHIGDTVIVRESRPLSRSKRWRLIEVVERAK